jgi:capsular exopolysaccharide synthesis family protein
MSKIYEALRQAEQERAKNPSPPLGPGSGAPATVLDPEAAPEVDAGSFATGASTVVPAGERTFAAALADTRLSDGLGDHKVAFAPVAGIPGDASDLDLGKIGHYPWYPLMQQLPALEERGSSVEQFRSLRSRMQEFRDLGTLKSILVSSGLPQEGKSFIAANLAIAFARHRGGRVLLIDGDMRRATLHKLFGCAQHPGLTEFLTGAATLPEIMQRPLPGEPGRPLPSGLLSLTFIPAGIEHDKAADLSGNHRFDRLIAAAAPHFDWIVVDSSPVNLVSDGVNLARACDAVLLVARGGVTKFESAQRAIAELKASKVLGLVLNAVAKPILAGGYYGYDGYDKVEA